MTDPTTFRIAIVVTSRLEDAGRSAIHRARMFAQDLRDAGDDVCIVFKGAGSGAAATLAETDNTVHVLFVDVKPLVHGACRCGARACAVLAPVKVAGLPTLEEDRGHASLRGLLLVGPQIVTV